MPSYDTVTYITKNKVATIKMNRTKQLNAFNCDMRRDLLLALKAAQADANVRMIVLGGEGRAFCAGADLNTMLESYLQEQDFESVLEVLKEEFAPIIHSIDQSPKLVMASVQGAAAGIGSAIALCCDLVVMAEDAYIYEAFAAIGLIPDGGACFQLLNAMGYRKAMEVIVTGEKFAAADCQKVGMANRVVATENLDAEVQAWAEELAAGSPLAQKFSKLALKFAQSNSLQDTIVQEAVMQRICSESDDCKSAIQSFFAKETPVFKGK